MDQEINKKKIFDLLEDVITHVIKSKFRADIEDVVVDRMVSAAAKGVTENTVIKFQSYDDEEKSLTIKISFLRGEDGRQSI